MPNFAHGTITRCSVLAVLFVLGGSPTAHSQDGQYPNKRVNLLVGFAVGGFADSVGRIIGRKLSERLMQSFIVQNVDGAGGNIAARQVSIAPADGYTLLVTTTSLAINETLAKNKSFGIESLIPIAIPVEAPELLVANPKSGIRSVGDALQQARSGKLYFSSSGVGSGSHIAVEYFFKALAKVEAKHIPFKGGNPAMHALVTGEVDLLASTATAKPFIRNGQLLGLAVASDQRDPTIPEVPTYAELGFPGFKASSWVGVFAPAGTPHSVIQHLNAEINLAVGEPDVQRQLEQLGLLTSIRRQEDTAAMFKADVSSWRAMVQAINLENN